MSLDARTINERFLVISSHSQFVKAGFGDAESEIVGVLRQSLWFVVFMGLLVISLVFFTAPGRQGFSTLTDSFELPGGWIWALIAVGLFVTAFTILTTLLRVEKGRFEKLFFFLLLFSGSTFALIQSGLFSGYFFQGALGFESVPGSATLLSSGAGFITAGAAYVVFERAGLAASKLDRHSAIAIPLGFALLATFFGVAGLTLPPGVNQTFSSQVWPFALVLSGLAVAVCVKSPRLDGSNGVSSYQRRRSSPALLFFLLTPLVFLPSYILPNYQYLSIWSAGFLLATLTAIAAAGTIVIPAALSRFAEPKLLSGFFAAGMFTLVGMASFSDSFGWFDEGSLITQVAILAIAVAVMTVLARVKPRLVSYAVVLFLVFQVPAVALASLPSNDGTSPLSSLSASTGENSPYGQLGEWKDKPDVFFLVYESYANEETMNFYGIDNSRQMDFLLDSGFTIYDGTYTLTSGSLASMSKVLDISSERVEAERLVLSGESSVARAFQSQGYRTAGIFSTNYFSLGVQPSYDDYFPLVPLDPNMLLLSVARGEFRFDDSYTQVDYGAFLQRKREAMAQTTGQPPLFLHSHNSLPGHSQNSGVCRPNESRLYAERLLEANREMTADIRAVPDLDNAILIVAGDHGPSLTQNCSELRGVPQNVISREDVQDRLGAFLAIRWPDGLQSTRKIQVLQEIFPTVFSELSGDPGLAVSLSAETPLQGSIGEVRVLSGTVRGGRDDGEALFLSSSIRGGR